MRKTRRLRRALLTTGVVLTLLIALLSYLTRPAALRAVLVRTLESYGLDVRHVGAVWFNLASGLHATDIEIARPGAAALARRWTLVDVPPLARVGYGEIRCSWMSLLTGHFRPREIRLRDVAISLIRIDADEAFEWPVGSETGPARGVLDASDLPRLRLERVDVQALAAAPGELRLLRRWIIRGWGDVRQSSSSQGEYHLAFEQVAGPAARPTHASGSRAPLAELAWREGALRLAFDTFDVDSLIALLPQAWCRPLLDLGLTGFVRIREIAWTLEGLRSIELALDGMNFSLPVEADLAAGQADQRFLQVRNAHGRLALTRSAPTSTDQSQPLRATLELDLNAQVNGAAAQLTWTARGLDVAQPLQPAHDAGPPSPDASAGRPTTSPSWLPATGECEGFVRVQGLTLPGPEHTAFVHSPQFPPAFRAFFEDYQPVGAANVELRVRKSAAADDWSVEGEFEPVSGHCRYFRFPYRIDDIHGRVRFGPQGVDFLGLTGRHGSASVRMDGHLNDSREWTGFDLSITARNVALERELFAALPESYQQLWKQADPVGLADVQVALTRAEGDAAAGPREPEVRVDARLRSGQLALGQAGALRDAEGRIHVEHGIVTIQDVFGFVGQSSVRLNGQATIAGPDGQMAYSAQVEAADWPLVREVPLFDSSGASLGSVALAGVGDWWARIESGHAGAPAPLSDIALRLKHGTLRALGAASWSAASGWFVLAEDHLRIAGLRAESASGAIEADGVVSSSGALLPGQDLRIRITDRDLATVLPGAVPAGWAAACAALGLAGAGRVEARLQAAAPDGSPTVDMKLQAAQMTPPSLPLKLCEVQADVQLDADGFVLRGGSGRLGAAGQVELSGKGGWHTGQTWAEFSARARGVLINEDLIKALPSGLRDLLRRMTASGDISAELDSVRVTGGADGAWQFDGRLNLKGAAVRLGLALKKFDGQIAGNCTVRGDGEVALDAEFTIERGLLAGRPIKDWEGRLRRVPGERWVRLEDLRGGLCGGMAIGFLNIDPQTTEYELSLTLHDLALDEFLQPSGQQQPPPRQGRLDGRLFLRGHGSDAGTRLGGGELRLRGTTLRASPVTAQLPDIENGPKRSLSAEVDMAELRFAWEGSTLKFSRVDIRSHDSRLIGQGEWNMDTDTIALTLLGAAAEGAPRLAVISDVLDLAGRELIQYRIEGPSSSPKVSVEALANLTEPLRRLIGGQADDR